MAKSAKKENKTSVPRIFLKAKVESVERPEAQVRSKALKVMSASKFSEFSGVVIFSSV